MEANTLDSALSRGKIWINGNNGYRFMVDMKHIDSIYYSPNKYFISRTKIDESTNPHYNSDYIHFIQRDGTYFRQFNSELMYHHKNETFLKKYIKRFMDFHSESFYLFDKGEKFLLVRKSSIVSIHHENELMEKIMIELSGGASMKFECNAFGDDAYSFFEDGFEEHWLSV